MQLFSPLGNVKKAHVVMDAESGLCKNYGFVEMENYSDACNAIKHLNGGTFDGRTLKVKFSEPTRGRKKISNDIPSDAE